MQGRRPGDGLTHHPYTDPKPKGAAVPQFNPTPEPQGDTSPTTERLSVQRLSAILRLSQSENRTLAEMDAALADILAEKFALNDELIDVKARLSAVLDLCDREQRGAMRWENPLPVPEWVGVVQRAALGDDKRADLAARPTRDEVLNEAADAVVADADRMDRVLGTHTETASTKRTVAVHLRAMAAEIKATPEQRAAQSGGAS